MNRHLTPLVWAAALLLVVLSFHYDDEMLCVVLDCVPGPQMNGGGLMADSNMAINSVAGVLDMALAAVVLVAITVAGCAVAYWWRRRTGAGSGWSQE